MTTDANSLRSGLGRYLSPEQLRTLGSVRIGIAGAGGLGSNTAMLLARSGIEQMLVIDHDVVDRSNLGRQHYWPRHVGRKKVAALAETLLELNPDISLETLDIKLDECSLPAVLARCPIWVEALDAADSKTLLVEQALLNSRRVVSASGICGVGGPPMRKRKMGNLVLVGDFRTGVEMAPPLAPRVMQAAAMMADSVLEMVLNGPIK